MPSISIDGDGKGPTRSTIAVLIPTTAKQSTSISWAVAAFGQPGLLRISIRIPRSPNTRH
ncbi:hypothetical protein L838_3111 [Mycobacterium avium MAV_120709_2344]|nr:hypothetical protein L838_3111 [Mycobacterium avium MAV_120709_2344]